MSRRQEKFFTPPTLSVSPAPEPIKMIRQAHRPQKMWFNDRLSTPNVAVMIKSPNISPIPNSSIRSLDFESPRLKDLDRSGSVGRGNDSFNSSSFISPADKSVMCPLNDHLDLKLILKEFELDHLASYFERKQIGIIELSEMKEEDFVKLGIFKLNELDKLKRICNMLNDSQNNSY